MGRASFPHLSTVSDVPGNRWPFSVSVVIAALNEGATIGGVVERILEYCPGAEVLVIDDRSTDDTAARAEAAGARVIRRPYTLGQGAGVKTGVRAAQGDIIVLIDGDGQHDPAYIPRLVAPILLGEADVVVGVRPLAESTDISPVRRRGNQIGSWVFTRLVKMPISDATSGYRAFSREALLRLSVISEYTYTLETLIRSARMRLAVKEVAVPALPRTSGESRMTRSVARYVGHTGGQAFRTMLHANPLTFFARGALAMTVLSAALTGWFIFGYQSGGLHLPALLAALLTFVLAVGLFVSGLIADGITTSHRLLEEVLYHSRRVEYDRRLNELPFEASDPLALERTAPARSG